jgi:transcriptional regulator with XRE-family HTH domain
MKEKSGKVNFQLTRSYLAKMKTTEDPPISAAMIRAARGLLNISQEKLGELANVSTRTLIKIEAGLEGRPDSRRRDVLDAIRKILEDNYSIEFIFPDGQTGEGVRIRRLSKG